MVGSLEYQHPFSTVRQNEGRELNKSSCCSSTGLETCFYPTVAVSVTACSKFFLPKVFTSQQLTVDISVSVSGDRLVGGK